MSVIVDFSIAPMDKGESVSTYVARAVALIKDSGLAYRMGPMGTSIEGDWNPVMDVVRQCFEALRCDCNRITMTIKVDYRRGTSGRLQAKIASVARKLPDDGRPFQSSP